MHMRRHLFESRQFLKQKHYEDPTAYLVVFIHHISFKFMGTFLALLNIMLSDFEASWPRRVRP